MEDSYFCWLVGLIGDEYVGTHYQKLLWKLYTTDYIWELDYDRNRAADGLYLRREFAKLNGYFVADGDVFQDPLIVEGRPCSVLEMMIALARDAENDIMHDPDYGDRSGKWFWIMIQNLGLDVYDDYCWFEAEVDRILDVFLHRRYQTTGPNAPFPVKNSATVFANRDLWWQMNQYFEANFPV